jgi:hypothetical protein
MEEETITWAVGAAVGALGLLGIVLAAGAFDDGIYVFGWSLAAFSLAFIGNLMRQGLAQPAKTKTEARHHG